MIAESGNPLGSKTVGRVVRIRFLVSALAFVAVATASPAHAEAQRHSPPILSLLAGSKFQRGLMGSNCWSYTNPDGTGTGSCGDVGGYRWPSPKEVVRGKRARLLLRFPERPLELDLTSYRRLNADRSPAGRGHRVAYCLQPVLQSGTRVAWAAVFTARLSMTTGPWYLDVFARWTEGDAGYDFHLKLV